MGITKKLLFIATLAFGMSALACPQVSGSFSCNEKKNTALEFSQKVEKGVYVYTINKATYRADNILRTLSYDAQHPDHSSSGWIEYPMIQKVYCEGETLKVWTKTLDPHGPWQILNLREYSLDSNKNLVLKESFGHGDTSLEEKDLDEPKTILCNRD